MGRQTQALQHVNDDEDEAREKEHAAAGRWRVRGGEILLQLAYSYSPAEGEDPHVARALFVASLRPRLRSGGRGGEGEGKNGERRRGGRGGGGSPTSCSLIGSSV